MTGLRKYNNSPEFTIPLKNTLYTERYDYLRTPKHEQKSSSSEKKSVNVEKRYEDYVNTITPIIQNMIDNHANNIYKMSYDVLYQAALNYFDYNHELPSGILKRILYSCSKNSVNKFLNSKNRITVDDKIHKISKRDSMYGIKFTKPQDIQDATKFIIGSVANRILGYSESRGRIYTRHSTLFVYKCDLEDKKLLFKAGKFNRITGKIHLVVAKDIEELLLKHPDYRFKADRNNVNLNGFYIPSEIVAKMRKYKQ